LAEAGRSLWQLEVCSGAKRRLRGASWPKAEAIWFRHRCEACGMLKPHLARLHQLVNAGDKMPLPLFVATIDAERWTELAAVHSVTEYPSLLYFAAGRRAAPATFPGTDMASLLHFVGVQAQLGSAGADGHGFGVEGRAEPSASASASASASSPGGGAAQWPNGPMGAIACRC